jgi:hypothetical protein
VMLCMNVEHPAGLVNGATGIVIDIVFEEGQTDAVNLPSFVIVDFGEQYKGPNLFGGDESRRGWVPIPALEFDYSVPDLKEPSKYKHVTRKQIPLRLAYAFTIHKAQGQTFRNSQIVIDLGKKEISTGMSYVAMSRATRLSQIGFIGALTLSRITEKISGKPFLKVRLAEEERLDQLELVTCSRLQDEDSLAGVQEEGEDSEEEQAVENPFGNDEDEGCEEEPAVNPSYEDDEQAAAIRIAWYRQQEIIALQRETTAMEGILMAEEEEDSEEEQASLNRMITEDEDDSEEEEPAVNPSYESVIRISQLPINDHSTRQERITFFRQREIASMERILQAEKFHEVVPETSPISSWLESFSESTEKEELTPLRVLNHHLLRVYKVHKDHCILLDSPTGIHFELPYRLTQWAFNNNMSFDLIAQFLETDLLGEPMPVEVVLMSDDSHRTPIVATRLELVRIMEGSLSISKRLDKRKRKCRPEIIRPLARTKRTLKMLQ